MLRVFLYVLLVGVPLAESAVETCQPCAEGETFLLSKTTEIDGRLRDILWTTVDRRGVENEISHCYYNLSYCFDFTMEFTPSRKLVGQTSYENTMELNPVTAAHRGMTLHIQNFARNTEETSPAYSCLMDVYALPHKPVCRVRWLGRNRATVTCVTDKSYPDAVCQFFKVNEDTNHVDDVSGGKDVSYKNNDLKEDGNNYQATTCSLEVSLPADGRFSFYALMKPRGAPDGDDAFTVRTPNTKVIIVDDGLAKVEELVDEPLEDIKVIKEFSGLAKEEDPLEEPLEDTEVIEVDSGLAKEDEPSEEPLEDCKDFNEHADAIESRGTSGRTPRHVSNKKPAIPRKHPYMKVGKSVVKHEERVSRVGESENLEMSCEIETADVDSGFLDIVAVCRQDGRVVANQTSTSHKVVFVLSEARGMGDVRCECKSRFQERCGMRHFGWFKIQVDDYNGNNEKISNSTLYEILLVVLLSVMAVGVFLAVCLITKVSKCRYAHIYETVPNDWLRGKDMSKGRQSIVTSKETTQIA